MTVSTYFTVVLVLSPVALLGGALASWYYHERLDRRRRTCHECGLPLHVQLDHVRSMYDMQVRRSAELGREVETRIHQLHLTEQALNHANDRVHILTNERDTLWRDLNDRVLL